jgi:hypothetical protein
VTTTAEITERSAAALDVVLPRAFKPAFRCPTCGHFMERAENFWVCPVAFHSKAVTDAVMLSRLTDVKLKSGRQSETRRTDPYRVLGTACGVFGRRPRVERF